MGNHLPLNEKSERLSAWPRCLGGRANAVQMCGLRSWVDSGPAESEAFSQSDQFIFVKLANIKFSL